MITTPYTGCTVKTYRCRYDKETKEVISRDFEARSQYKRRDEVIAKIVNPPTEDPSKPTEDNKPTEDTKPTESTQPPTTETTAPPTTETTAPPTTETTAPPTTESTEASSDAA